jgi:predicted transcriptional regulator
MDSRMLKRVDGMARAMSRSRAWVINQAIERYLDYEEWFVGAVKRGLKEAETGELVEHEAMVRGWESKRGAKVDARR